jgi:hypothetical protein
MDRQLRRRWPGDSVETRGWWFDAAGRERAFIGSVSICPRFRPHLFAVVREQETGTETTVRVSQVRGVHLRMPRRDLSVPGSPCDCPASTERVPADAVTVCLDRGARLRLKGLDGFDFAVHLETAWPRASLRLVGTFF